MTKQKELIKLLTDFRTALRLILESVSNFKNEEEFELVENIFNGGTEEGYAQNRYANCFKYSFEDEFSSYDSFLEEFAYSVESFNIILNRIHEYNDYTSEKGNVQAIIKGLELGKESLSNIVDFCKENSDLKEQLVNFTSEEIDHNPFKEFGVIEFEKKFRGWSRAFQKELKDELGKRKLASIKSNI